MNRIKDYLLAAACIIVYLIAGCNTLKKQTATFHNFAYQHPDILAQDCAKQFPPKDSIGKPIILPSHNIDYTPKIDSLQSLIDSLAKRDPKIIITDNLNEQLIIELKAQITALKRGYVPCGKDTVLTPHYITDNAKLNVVLAQSKSKSDSLIIVKTQSAIKNKTIVDKNKWLLLAYGFIGLSGIVWILKFFKRIP